MLEQSTVSDDQPIQESTQQNELDQVNEQPETTGEDVQEESQETDSEAKTESAIEIDGEKLTPEQIKEYKAGYLRQQDYTKKTQELAEEKRKLSRSEVIDRATDELDPEVKTALEILKKAGVVTKEDLALMKAQEEDQKQFKRLIKKYPDLKTHEKAISQIGKVDNRAWEDIAIEYGFLNKDKLSKAKESQPVVGQKSITPSKSKSIMDMDAAEFTAWKAQNLGDGLRSIN